MKKDWEKVEMFQSRVFLRSFCSKAARNYEVVFPENVSLQRNFEQLPKNISIPAYAASGIPPEKSKNDGPEIHTPASLGKIQQFEGLKIALNIVKFALYTLKIALNTLKNALNPVKIALNPLKIALNTLKICQSNLLSLF